MSKEFVVSAGGDAHVGTDLKQGRESLAEAISQADRGARPRRLFR